MSIRTIDHVNIATQRLEATRAFYVEVMGLTEGFRPPFEFPGYWLYAGERAIVHMQEANGPVGPSQASALNHFAFDVDALDPILAELDKRGIAYRAVDVPETRIRQAFLQDPNGVRVELNYRPR